MSKLNQEETKMAEWISLSDGMPAAQKRVLIAYNNGYIPVVTVGWYCPAKTLESENFQSEVDDEYDEATDTYYLKEQWVDESQESEYHYSISGVTHWQEMPRHPERDFVPF
jgi:hypothetical protein